MREWKRVEGERERAQAEAEAASRTKDEFFAMLGHELRNPLGVISTALHVLEVKARARLDGEQTRIEALNRPMMAVGAAASRGPSPSPRSADPLRSAR
jgi:signal transduction histidine kinase